MWLLPIFSAHPSVLGPSSIVIQSGPAKAEPGPLFTSKYIPLLRSGAFVVPLILALVLNFRKRPFQKVR